MKAILRAKSLLGEHVPRADAGQQGRSRRRRRRHAAGGQRRRFGRARRGLPLVRRPYPRPAFQTWQQQLAITGAGRGREIGEAFAQFSPLERESTKLLRVLDRNSKSFSDLIRNTGITFASLSARQDQLRSLVRNSNTVFATTAARNQQLAETFIALPTFQIESRALLRRLDTFADVANPVIKQLEPVATAFGPVFGNLEELAPDLRDFVVELGPTISASVKGVPAASPSCSPSRRSSARSTRR